MSDSEDSDLEEEQRKLESKGRKRSGSFQRLEEELYKKLQKRKEKGIQLLKQHNIRIDKSVDSTEIVSNFTKL